MSRRRIIGARPQRLLPCSEYERTRGQFTRGAPSGASSGREARPTVGQGCYIDASGGQVKFSTLVLLPIGLSLALEAQTTPATTTPIQHGVVIFQENVSFDHYF